MYNRSMETIYLSLRAQVAVSTFLIKSLVSTFVCTTPFRKGYQNLAKQLLSAVLALAAERSNVSVIFPKVVYLEKCCRQKTSRPIDGHSMVLP